MSLGKTWYTPEGAEAKFGVSKEQVLRWVEEGLVRSEREGDKVVLVNGDDLGIKVESLVSDAQG